MDFFQAQDHALNKTKQLVLLYLLAVLCIIVAVYFAVTFGFYTYVSLSSEGTSRSSLINQFQLISEERIIWSALGTVIVIGLGSLFKILELQGGGGAVATSLGGQRVDRSTNDHKQKQLLNVVEEMAIASGVPIPKVYILSRESSINAFAAGWSMNDAAIAVSMGALNELSRDELQGVIAHEFSHILNGDCRLNIRLMGVLFGIMMLSLFGRIMRSMIHLSPRSSGSSYSRSTSSSSRGKGSGKGGAIIIAVLVVILLVTIIGYIGSFFARLLQAAISRQREYLADASAIQFTRNPDGLAGALKKIGGHSRMGLLSHPSANEAAHMFFANGIASGMSGSLATHPPLRDRILKIEPGWNGRYPRPKRKLDHMAQPARRPSHAIPIPKRRSIEGLTLLGTIGTLSRDNIAVAKELTSHIPHELDRYTRDNIGAQVIIYALIMVDNSLDDALQWKIIESSEQADYAESIREIYPLVKKLPREIRLTVLELSTTTLAQSGFSNQEDFMALFDKLIGADKKISLYEFCFRRILLERLSRGDRISSSDSSVKYKNLKPIVAKAVSHLLSIVARETSGVKNPEELVRVATKLLYVLNGKIVYREKKNNEMAQLNNALDILRSSSFAIRSHCLRAVAYCIKADGKLSPEEAELLRTFCLSLDCPAPPILRELEKSI
ncbi:MAG: M48 family metallopeptidase [Planctomycetes bacterium]|nr:M48 family metallopeptidase [Planctomycetota bacterium]